MTSGPPADRPNESPTPADRLEPIQAAGRILKSTSMPIRFACEHCGQRLKVSSKKAGARAKCPKCAEPLVVPQPDSVRVHSAEEDTAATQSDDAADDDGYQDPFAQFIVYDDTELVYEQETDEAPPAVENGVVDPTKVAVPRKILYLQGALLGIVGILCFTLGVVVGGSGGGRRSNADAGPTPCIISGRVNFMTRDGKLVADEGAVAIVVPQGARPEEKIEFTGLSPLDPPPDAAHPGLMALRGINGDYARADEDGAYQLRVPDVGAYFLLIVSRQQRRSTTEDRPKNELAEMGRFFHPSPDIFDGLAYRWRSEAVRRDRQINEVFE